MLSSPIIDLAIGLTFVFGVTAAFASFVTELVARLIGLRAAYLLSGLRELVEGGGSSTNLVNMAADYNTMRELIQPSSKPAAQPAPAQPPAVESPPSEPSSAQQLSATGALLGGPVLSNQGIAGQFSSRKLKLGPTSGTGRLPKMTADRKAGRLWSQRRSLRPPEVRDEKGHHLRERDPRLCGSLLNPPDPLPISNIKILPTRDTPRRRISCHVAISGNFLRRGD